MKFICDSKFIILPVSHTAQMKALKFYNNGNFLFLLNIELDFISPDYEVYINVERFNGMELELLCEIDTELTIKKSNINRFDKQLYKEKLRPEFHFSPKRGWINDPNGLVYYNGTYHMFFQHNPVGCKWANMHWGHAVSTDLLHWKELDCALYPNEIGTIFSGSAIIDKNNVTGLKENENDVILLFYTQTGEFSGNTSTQCIAYSTDGGKTFSQYKNNPVVKNIASWNRDPKVIHHKATNSYFMALFLCNNKYAILKSKNLLDWSVLQKIDIENEMECPDFFPLYVDDDPKNEKWILIGGSDKYIVGDFNGEVFTPIQGTKTIRYGKHSYAAQTWSDIEDDRRIRIAWNTHQFPGATFNNSMTFPCEMTCKKINGDYLVCVNPINEMEKLYKSSLIKNNVPLNKEQPFSLELNSTSYDILLKVSDICGTDFSIEVFGMKVYCSMATNKLKCLDTTAPLYAIDNTIQLRFLIDKTGIEIFANRGSVYVCNGFFMDYNLKKFKIKVNGVMNIDHLSISELGSIW